MGTKNRFLRFDIFPIPPEPGEPPRRVYALLDQVETLGDGNITLLFDSVDASWFDDYGAPTFGQNPPTRIPVDYFDAARVYVLEWTINLRRPPGALSPLDLNRPSSEDDETWLLPLEQNWVQFELAPSIAASSEAQLYYNLFADPIQVSVTSTGQLPNSLSTALKQSDPLAPIPDSSIPDISNEIRAALGSQKVDHLGIYDVGQGNCAGLSIGGRTAIYSDFGGGVLANRSTFPVALKHFCFCPIHQPPIILSHWDWDHWSSASRDTRSYTSLWIVPRQKPLGHVHGAFIASVLGGGGNFLVWPKASRACSVGQVTIDRCTGTRRNDSGLAVKVAPPTGTAGDPILLPGDAIYNYLPSAIAAPFDAICCPHHGGNLHGGVAPNCPANIQSRLAYSFGKGNSYKHPVRATRIEHDNKGWYDPAISSHPTPLVRETIKRNASGLGHIAVGWTTWNRPPTISCGGRSCHLQAQQT
jgi:hypothetical protein